MKVSGSHARRLTALAAAFGVSVVTAASASAASTPPNGGILPVSAPKTCGQDVTWKHSGSAWKSLSSSAQSLYQAYPYAVDATPWAHFKKKKGPWKIGYINFPINNPWQVTLTSGLQQQFAAAKKKGLVSGSLQTYIQPSTSTATPEQQDAAIMQMVHEGVDGILLHPLNAIAEAPTIDAAGRAGVPVVLTSDVAPNSKYAINVFSQNNSPSYAGTLDNMVKHGLIGKGKTTNVLMVRGIAGVTVEQAFYTAAMDDLKPCKGVNVVGTVWGQWNAATAKTQILTFLASHPQPVNLVFQSSVASGVIEAFQQDGRQVPVMNLGGSAGGDLTWWSQNKNTTFGQNAVGGIFGGFQVAYTTFRVLLRVLNGDGLKVNSISLPPVIATAKNISTYAYPGKPLTWIGDIRGPADGWANNTKLNLFFSKPGSPGNL